VYPLRITALCWDVGADGVGLTGIELSMDDYSKGKMGGPLELLILQSQIY
jgi:hypothetical protein